MRPSDPQAGDVRGSTGGLRQLPSCLQPPAIKAADLPLARQWRRLLQRARSGVGHPIAGGEHHSDRASHHHETRQCRPGGDNCQGDQQTTPRTVARSASFVVYRHVRVPANDGADLARPGDGRRRGPPAPLSRSGPATSLRSRTSTGSRGCSDGSRSSNQA